MYDHTSSDTYSHVEPKLGQSVYGLTAMMLYTALVANTITMITHAVDAWQTEMPCKKHETKYDQNSHVMSCHTTPAL